jgi:hypothetical protein
MHLIIRRIGHHGVRVLWAVYDGEVQLISFDCLEDAKWWAKGHGETFKVIQEETFDGLV